MMPFPTDDTIAAVSTPPGRSGLGIVRLSGPDAVRIAEKLFRPSGPARPAAAPSHTLHHGRIVDADDRTLDEVVLAVMRAPHSYTAEDVVEISAHGSPVILSAILRLCLEHGARAARPGEFTFRAFMRGRIDLSRAEAVADLIDSKTELAARTAVHQLEGSLFRRVGPWRERLIELLAELEAALDYSEEDIAFITPDRLQAALGELDAQAGELIATARRGAVLRNGLRTAIIGRPNTGKSSLLNALLRRERAIVTDIPGTTRDVIEETLDCRGIPLVIMDTAGLRRHTLDPVEKIGQERTLDCVRTADLVLWLIDAGDPLSEADRHVAALLERTGAREKTIPVLNKTDRGLRADEGEVRSLLPCAAPVRISALTGAGLADLEQAVVDRVPAAGSGETTCISLRHEEVIRRCRQALSEARAAQERGESEEFIAFHLREALAILGEITGETSTEELLGNIFSRFCVGK